MSDIETSMEIMKKKEKQILELSNEEDDKTKEERKDTNNTKEEDFEVNKMKMGVQNIDGFIVKSKTAEANFCQCCIGKRSWKCFQDCWTGPGACSGCT